MDLTKAFDSVDHELFLARLRNIGLSEGAVNWFRNYLGDRTQYVCTSFLEINIQWGKKVFSQPPIVQVLPLKKTRENWNFHHKYTSTMTDKMRKTNPENHIVGF